MPVMRCKVGKKVGFKWGQVGKCYTYDLRSPASRNRAKKKAILQGTVIKSNTNLKTDALTTEKPFITWLKALGLSVPKIRSRLRKKPPELIVPRTVERKYIRALRRLVTGWRVLYLEMVDPHLEGLAQEAYAMKPPEAVGVKTDHVNDAYKYSMGLLDSWPQRLTDIMDGYEQRLTQTLKPVDQLTTGISYDVSDLNMKKWRRTLTKVFEIDVFANEPWLQDQLNSWAVTNTNLITKIADDTRVNIEREIRDGFQQGKRIESIRKEILANTALDKGVFKDTRTRAELIARTETAKLNGQLTQLRQNELGIDRYTWRDVNDERVRVSHSTMDGRLCDWTNSLVYSDDGGKTWNQRSSIGGVELHPGFDFNCRCYAAADFSSILE